MSSDMEWLRKRAQQQAEQDQIREEQERIATVEFGRAAAREDLSSWKRCIEKQMRSGSERWVRIFHDTYDHHSRVRIYGSAQGAFLGLTYATGFRRVLGLGVTRGWRARSAYLEELRRLLGSPFRVSERISSSDEMTGYTEDSQRNRSYAYAYSSGPTYECVEVEW